MTSIASYMLLTGEENDPGILAPSAWYEPDFVVLDDVFGPAALAHFAEMFGPTKRVVDARRVRVISSVDPSNAMPDRQRVDALLEAFASAQEIPFIRDINGCKSGCSTDLGLTPGSLIASTISPLHAPQTRACIVPPLSPADIAVALGEGRIWLGRPEVEVLRLTGRLKPGCTVHDLAISLRPKIRRAGWLVISSLVKQENAFDARQQQQIVNLLEDSPAAMSLWMPPGMDLHLSRDARNFSLIDVRPMIGEGHERSTPVDEHEPTRIDRVYIGSCTTGSIDDLKLAAGVLIGEKVKVPTVISPATRNDLLLLEEASLERQGPKLIEIFRQAGCDIALPGCAGCVNALADASTALEARDDAVGGNTKNGLQAYQHHDKLNVMATAVANITTRKVARVLTASTITAAQTAIKGGV